jgi:hypothetical protein
MRQPHPPAFYKHLNASTRDIMAAMNARAAFAVPGGSAGDLREFVHDGQIQRGDENGELARLAVAMLRLHGSFAQRGARGPRDANDNSVPLVLAVKAARSMLEQRR